MFKATWYLAVSVLLAANGSASGQDLPAALETYRSLSNAVRDAEGIGFVEFNSGNFFVEYKSFKMTWQIEPDTYCNIRFRYINKFLDEVLLIDFNKKVTVILQGNIPLKLQFTHLYYDGRGVVVSHDIKIINEDQIGAAGPNILA